LIDVSFASYLPVGNDFSDFFLGEGGVWWENSPGYLFIFSGTHPILFYCDSRIYYSNSVDSNEEINRFLWQCLFHKNDALYWSSFLNS
jgi:hypothetical protein